MQNDETIVDGEFFVEHTWHVMKQKSEGIIASVSSVFESLGVEFEVVDYAEHALSKGKNAKAVAYFAVKVNDEVYYGAGTGKNISYASISALVSALNVANEAVSSRTY